MAYLPNYTYDIFISYSHVDNATTIGQPDGWIECFYKNLRVKLAQRLGRMDAVNIWWDNKKIDGNTTFDSSIETGIQQSAIMISLVSPGYLNSEYCKKELNLFYKKINNEPVGSKVDDRSRILNVLLSNVHYNKWPEELKGTTGFTFHDAEGTDNFGDPLDVTTPAYKQHLSQLCDAIVNLLQNFPKAEVNTQPEIATAEEEKAEPSFSIYFGEVPDTLRTIRKRTIAELEKNGYTIFCGVPPPDEEIPHQKKVLEYIQKANLSIHLLDQYPGKEIVDKPDLFYSQKQAELALSLEKPKLIWMPKEVVIEDVEEESYKQFLQNLKDHKEASDTYQFIKDDRSAITKVILDEVDMQKKTWQQAQAATTAKVAVLLDTHYNDQLYALDVGKTLLENDIQPFINPQEDDPLKNINILEERISQVSNLIFFYGRVSRDWVLKRMSAALQLIITHNFPIEDFYVFMAPPHKSPDDISLHQRFLKINVIDNSGTPQVSKERVALLLNELKGHHA